MDAGEPQEDNEASEKYAINVEALNEKECFLEDDDDEDDENGRLSIDCSENEEHMNETNWRGESVWLKTYNITEEKHDTIGNKSNLEIANKNCAQYKVNGACTKINEDSCDEDAESTGFPERENKSIINVRDIRDELDSFDCKPDLELKNENCAQYNESTGLDERVYKKDTEEDNGVLYNTSNLFGGIGENKVHLSQFHQNHTSNRINSIQGHHTGVFICRKPWCRKKISGTQDDYEGHVRMCKKPRLKKSTVCPQCDKQFSKVSNLNRHVATVHSALRKYICKNCKKSYSDVDKLDNHLQRCTQSTFNSMSKKIFVIDNKTVINSGTIDNNTPIKTKPDTIIINGKLSAKVRNGNCIKNGNGIASEHFSDHTSSNNHSDNEVSAKDTRNNSASSYEMNADVIPLPSQRELLLKVKGHNSDVFPMKSMKSREFKELKNRQAKSTLCVHCNKQFSRVSNLNRHVRLVHEAKKYCCKDCAKSYASEEKLHEHFLMMHSPFAHKGDNHSHKNNDTSFIENVPKNKSPGHVYKTLHNVMVDVKEIDDDKNEFIAELTRLDDSHHEMNLQGDDVREENKVFILDEMTQGDFISEKIRLEDKPRYDFSTNKKDSDSIKYHIKEENHYKTKNHTDKNEHHTIPSETEIEVDEESQGDGYDSPTMSAIPANNSLPPFLNEHNRDMIKSKPVDCPHCQKQFSKRSNLNRHIITVHDIKYTCENCSKSFVQSEKLERHILFSSCKFNDSSYRLLKADTALPCMVIEEVFHQEKRACPVSPI